MGEIYNAKSEMGRVVDVWVWFRRKFLMYTLISMAPYPQYSIQLPPVHRDITHFITQLLMKTSLGQYRTGRGDWGYKGIKKYILLNKRSIANPISNVNSKINYISPARFP